MWVRHAERMGETINAYKIFVGNHNGRYHLENKGADARKILNRNLKFFVARVRT
jgi:hypothetical protein